MTIPSEFAIVEIRQHFRRKPYRKIIEKLSNTLRKKPPRSVHIAYIFSAAISCCLSHIVSCFCTSFSKHTLSWNTYIRNPKWTNVNKKLESTIFLQNPKHAKENTNNPVDRDLIAGIDINGSDPELEGALPRPELSGKLFSDIIEIQRRQHSAVPSALRQTSLTRRMSHTSIIWMEVWLRTTEHCLWLDIEKWQVNKYQSTNFPFRKASCFVTLNKWRGGLPT